MSIVFVTAVRFRPARRIVPSSVLFFTKLILKGYVLKSYVHQQSCRLAHTVSMASNRLFPSNLYGLLTLYAIVPSTQSLCCFSAYWIASFAVQFFAPFRPLIFSGVISPNRIRSFSAATTCSSCTVVVFCPYAWRMLFTRHTMPFPGSVSSCSQVPMESAGASGPRVSVAVLSRSFSCRLMLSTGIFRLAVRLCPLRISIYNHLA